LDIAPVNRSVIESALASRMRDFEDAVLAAAGTLVSVQAIATRNKHDFRLVVHFINFDRYSSTT
jgi:hypothetical protein